MKTDSDASSDLSVDIVSPPMLESPKPASCSQQQQRHKQQATIKTEEAASTNPNSSKKGQDNNKINSKQAAKPLHLHLLNNTNEGDESEYSSNKDVKDQVTDLSGLESGPKYCCTYAQNELENKTDGAIRD